MHFCELKNVCGFKFACLLYVLCESLFRVVHIFADIIEKRECRRNNYIVNMKPDLTSDHEERSTFR